MKFTRNLFSTVGVLYIVVLAFNISSIFQSTSLTGIIDPCGGRVYDFLINPKIITNFYIALVAVLSITYGFIIHRKLNNKSLIKYSFLKGLLALLLLHAIYLLANQLNIINVVNISRGTC